MTTPLDPILDAVAKDISQYMDEIWKLAEPASTVSVVVSAIATTQHVAHHRGAKLAALRIIESAIHETLLEHVDSKKIIQLAKLRAQAKLRTGVNQLKEL